MTRHFQNAIEELKKKILHLTAMVEENLLMAVKAATRRDSGQADMVVENDIMIDRMEVEVEEEGLKILALYQPVAIDLRFIIAVLKINNDLERIGDEASNIAKRAIEVARWNRTDVPFDLAAMLRLAVKMVKRSTDALVGLDAEEARDVCRSDDEMDDYHRLALQKLKEGIMADPQSTPYFISLLGISKSLERIADHSTNIAEDVIYMVEGEIIRHRGPAADAPPERE